VELHVVAAAAEGAGKGVSHVGGAADFDESLRWHSHKEMPLLVESVVSIRLRWMRTWLLPTTSIWPSALPDSLLSSTSNSSSAENSMP